MQRHLWLTASIFVLFSCATPYQRSGVTGGVSIVAFEDGIYRLSFRGNGYTTRETAQTYWLYGCAEMALERGYDGFEILSHMELVQGLPTDDSTRSVYALKARPVDMEGYPVITGDIRFLKGRIETKTPKIFNAADLKKRLEPYVNGDKCGFGNVCAHAHTYVY